jgi:hypothetical protein
VVYLVIIVVIAAAGIGRLWLIQRRHTTSLSSVEGFRSSLERLAGQQPVSAADGSSTASYSSELGAEAGAGESFRASQKVAAAGYPYVEPLDPERRAAAKRRLEARRRGASRSGLRSR